MKMRPESLGSESSGIGIITTTYHCSSRSNYPWMPTIMTHQWQSWPLHTPGFCLFMNLTPPGGPGVGAFHTLVSLPLHTVVHRSNYSWMSKVMIHQWHSWPFHTPVFCLFMNLTPPGGPGVGAFPALSAARMSAAFQIAYFRFSSNCGHKNDPMNLWL